MLPPELPRESGPPSPQAQAPRSASTAVTLLLAALTAAVVAGVVSVVVTAGVLALWLEDVAPPDAVSPTETPPETQGSGPAADDPPDARPSPDTAAASRRDETRRLVPGATARASIEEPGGTVQFRLDIPRDAIALDLRATCEDGPLNLSVTFAADGQPGEPGDPGDPDDGTDAWTSDASREQHLHVAEHASDAFAEGLATVEVTLEGDASPEAPARFELDAAVIRIAPAGGTIGPGEIAGTTEPASGFRRTYRVKMPAGARVARFDVVETDRDLDLFVDAGEPSVRTKDAAFSAEGPICLETLLAFGDDTPVPSSRIISLTVTDPTCYEEPVAFRVRVSFREDVPEDLRNVDPLPLPSAPKDRALLSSVELVLADGSTGSGTIVRADGLVLTAAHVVDCVDALDRMPTKLDDDEGPAPVVVSLGLDPRSAPRDLFRGHLVHTDPLRDVALVKITQGLRGQALPKGYVFPAAPVGRTMTVGVADEIVAVGYPGVGGIGSRNPVTASRGTFSGFDRGVHGLQGKTDALVSPGSSGGAVFDTAWTLTGVLVSTMDDGGGNALGYFVPIDEVPERWRDLLRTPAPR